MSVSKRIGLLLVSHILVGHTFCAHSQEVDVRETPEIKAEVLVVMRSNQEVHAALIDGLLGTQKESPPYNLNIMTAREFRDEILYTDSDFSPDLIVSLGTDLTAYIVALELSVPLLSAAIPRLSFEQLKQRQEDAIDNDARAMFSAIYLDQPFTRSLNLIQTILPETTRVGISLGPETEHYEAEIRAELSKRNLQLSMGKVDQESQLINTLDQVLDESDVLLGVVDPLVFSRTSAKNVLLTAYRWRVPLIGVSPAYVRAGALASVHATPSQLGIQLAEVIDQISDEHFQTLPEAQYPSQYGVSINYQVAEAMGIHIVDESLVLEQIKALEMPEGQR